MLTQSEHAKLRGAIKALRRALSRQLESEYFVNNRPWFLAGLGLSLVGLAALAWRWRFGIEPVALFLGIWLTAWTAGLATMLWRIVQTARQARQQPVLVAPALALAVFSLPFLAAEIFVAGLLTTMLPTHLVAATLLVGGTNIVFYHLLERPTLKGRGVLDQLAGFKSYLQGTQPHTKDYERGIQHFEEYLPHAIALGIEDRWAEGFGTALAPTSDTTHPASHYTPFWYADGASTGVRSFDASSFATSLGSSLSSTISSASSPPSSGRGGSGGGGGGGGSSGGGGGGGGGGGW